MHAGDSAVERICIIGVVILTLYRRRIIFLKVSRATHLANIELANPTTPNEDPTLFTLLERLWHACFFT